MILSFIQDVSKFFKKFLKGELSGQQFKERHSGSVGSQSGRSRSSAPLRSADGVFSFAKAVKAFAGWTAKQQVRETVGWFFDRSGAGEPPPTAAQAGKRAALKNKCLACVVFPCTCFFMEAHTHLRNSEGKGFLSSRYIFINGEPHHLIVAVTPSSFEKQGST